MCSKKINERCAKQYLVYPPKIVKRHTFSWLFSRFDRSRTESAARVSVSDQILFEIYVWAGYSLSFFSGVRGGGWAFFKLMCFKRSPRYTKPGRHNNDMKQTMPLRFLTVAQAVITQNTGTRKLGENFKKKNIRRTKVRIKKIFTII